jgi:hypothetical protein
MEGKLDTAILCRLAAQDFSRLDVIELEKRISQIFENVDGLGFCLSEARDLLSQWRGYASNGSGVAIGFSKNYLEKRCQFFENDVPPARFFLMPIVYEADEPIQQIKEFYDNIKPTIELGLFRVSRSGNDEAQQKLIADVDINFMKYAVGRLLTHLFLLKGAAFKEEREHRLFTLLVNIPWEKYSHRVAQNRIIPYRSFELNLSHPPILEVILGPKHETPVPIIQAFLEMNGFGKVKVEPSTATYR